MKAPIYRIRQAIERLQEIVDEAEARNIDEVETCSNTYGLNNFVSFGPYGFLDLNADVNDLFEDDNDEDC